MATMRLYYSRTGNEQDDIPLLVSADSMTIALVSSRDGKRDKMEI